MTKIVNDACLGHIELEPHITVLIDTPEFQRLRWISQMGLVPFVYPTASHCRFEHSIGTYWLATKLVRRMQSQLEDIIEGKEDKDENLIKEIRIDEVDVKCVQIAALLHDIGHGPFSHTWDNQVLPAVIGGTQKKHEDHFEYMFQIMKENNPEVREKLQSADIKGEQEELINRLIQGKFKKGDKRILFDIVSNKQSGMDVDKWDYINRDCIYLGYVTSNFKSSIERFIHFARPMKEPESDEQWRIAYRDKEALSIMEMFQVRHFEHQTACQHRKQVAIELMVVDGFKKCVEKQIISVENIVSPEWILQQTDGLLWQLHREHKIEEFDRIFKRKLYKPIFEAVSYGKKRSPKNEIETKLKAAFNEIEKEIRIHFFQFKLGSENENPIITIPFYGKNPNDKLFYLNKEKLPSNLNRNFNEARLTIFTNTDLDDTPKKLVKNRFCEYLKTYFTNNDWDIRL